jgi:hypothetical protein
MINNCLNWQVLQDKALYSKEGISKIAEERGLDLNYDASDLRNR